MMNSKKFSNALDNVRDEYVSEAIAYKNKRKRHNWAKWGVMAACLTLIVGAVFRNPTTHDGRRVISEYYTNSSGSYATPSPGEVNFTSEVREARNKYEGKKSKFFIGF